jgi:hypothetical protein
MVLVLGDIKYTKNPSITCLWYSLVWILKLLQVGTQNNRYTILPLALREREKKAKMLNYVSMVQPGLCNTKFDNMEVMSLGIRRCSTIVEHLLHRPKRKRCSIPCLWYTYVWIQQTFTCFHPVF